MKQTAIEWLMEQIQEQRENGDNDLRQTLYYCKQAKEMEKQQIINANWEASEDTDRAEKYYNETYKNK